MTHILLTGAGFTRNWDGWLAKELEGDLLARLADDYQLNRLLQSSSNYEEALEKAKSPGYSGVTLTPTQVKRFEKAIEESFWAMNTGLVQRGNMELAAEGPSIHTFLAKFDAIFTLNQDLLLELYYQPNRHDLGRWKGTSYPGIEPPTVPRLDAGEVVRLERRVATIGPTPPDQQPVYKLHGSVNWTDGTGSLFVAGGSKDAYVRSKPLLTGYFAELRSRLRLPGTRLMVIGYGFADEHVNQLIVDAWQANQSLGIYYVHPKGRDAIRQGQEKATVQWTPPIGEVRCIGESRRPLSTTFGRDRIEYDKLMRFFG